MASRGIEREGGRFCYRGFRCDRPAAAADHTRPQRRRRDTTQRATMP